MRDPVPVSQDADSTEIRFAEILAIADDAIISIDEDHLITLFNRGAERIFNYAAEEVIGQPLDLLLPEAIRAMHRTHVAAFAGSPEAARVMAQRREIFGRRKDHSEFPAEASISKLRLSSGMVFTVILRDISERKTAEIALRRAHDELEQRVRERTAQLEDNNRRLQLEILERKAAEARLAAQAGELSRSNADLEQFAYVASHDLQEPLRMVASYTQLLERRYREVLTGEAAEFMSFIVDGALRMQRIIHDLLAFSRVGTRARDFSPTPLGEVMQQVIASLGAAIEESGASVEVQDLPTLVADRTQMELLLQNLVANAIKFRGQQPPQIRVSAQRRDAEWIIAVTDNGIGIESRFSERIFVIFQRLHTAAEYPGTGIGLAICKKVVERHGGRIWLESQAGAGSTFYFSLPAFGHE